MPNDNPDLPVITIRRGSKVIKGVTPDTMTWGDRICTSDGIPLRRSKKAR